MNLKNKVKQLEDRVKVTNYVPVVITTPEEWELLKNKRNNGIGPDTSIIIDDIPRFPSP
jgi:hypothetical protein